MQYYKFNTKKSAIAAEAEISLEGGFPMVGRNAKTGELEPNKQITLRYSEPRKTKSGKWVFPRIPQNELDKLPKAKKDKFKSDHLHTIIEYSEDLFNQYDIEGNLI